MSDAPDTCYHCGSPLASALPVEPLRIGGVDRAMCCPGCRAVARAIVDGGLERYYLHRAAFAASPLPVVPDELAAFDDPAFQQAFVRPLAGGELEAAVLLEGLGCAACAWLVERTLAATPGVSGVEVNYATARARVRWSPTCTSLSAVLAAVAAVGYRARPFDASRAEELHRRERSRALAGLAIAGLGMMQVMMYAVPVWIADGQMTPEIESLMRWAGLLLTLPVLLYSAAPLFGGALRELRARAPGMDVPVCLGIVGAFAASLHSTFMADGPVYYDSVTMFVFLLLAARFVESQVRARAARATDELARLVPARAHRLSAWPRTDALEDVAVSALRAGDIVLVRPGERVPADGRVLDAAVELDEALLTGESRPVARGPGEPVTGGSVNLELPLLMQVERVGESTVLAAIVRLLDRAASARPPLAALADRAASRFVVGLLLVAAVTAVAWGLHDPSRALWTCVAVLVVTCPCALSLATPAALAAGTARLCRLGLLPTRAHAVETLARATHVVLDKTGTVTTGRLRVREWRVLPEALARCDADRVLGVVAALEHRSGHPVAQALLALAGDRGSPPAVDALRPVAGAGLEGVIDGVRWRLGSVAFAAAGGAAAVEQAADAMRRGDTVVVLGDDIGPVATFALADELRPGARELVRGLQADGLRVLLVSGDHPDTVAAMAARLGIAAADAIGAADPEAKLERVKSLQRSGAIVAVVGDGVNDAPVLAQAQVSIAMASGTALAQAAADMVWLAASSVSLARLLAGVRVSRATVSVVRQNLAWAAAYNLVAVPLAVAGMVTPWVAAVGMSASSLVVVLNAMRLLPPPEATPAAREAGDPARAAVAARTAHA
ncbi:MAG: heavy metal translocating P-type ATPase [Pseudomonadota bacterium]